LKIGSILALVVILAALALYFFVLKPPPETDDEPDPDPTLFLWSVDMEELQHMVISLPREDMSESFAKHEDRYWYFDDPPGPQVDNDRWGGGIPLLLSGPAANRLITEGATEEQLAVYGFNQPSMEITLTMENTDTLTINLGDSAPDGMSYYIKIAELNDIYTVDYTWYDVLEQLVLEPPYPPSEPE
jgi:hypothetical protein